jgi:hypothetical protein
MTDGPALPASIPAFSRKARLSPEASWKPEKADMSAVTVMGAG